CAEALQRNPAEPFETSSFSQEGEDRILARMFEASPKTQGIYVDIGAHHPFRFSNTFLFYQRGWSGLNVDAMPGSMRLFREFRPRDRNRETGVAEVECRLGYHIFSEPALNTFSYELAESYERTPGVERLKVI